MSADIAVSESPLDLFPSPPFKHEADVHGKIVVACAGPITLDEADVIEANAALKRHIVWSDANNNTHFLSVKEMSSKVQRQGSPLLKYLETMTLVAATGLMLEIAALWLSPSLSGIVLALGHEVGAKAVKVFMDEIIQADLSLHSFSITWDCSLTYSTNLRKTVCFAFADALDMMSATMTSLEMPFDLVVPGALAESPVWKTMSCLPNLARLTLYPRTSAFAADEAIMLRRYPNMFPALVDLSITASSACCARVVELTAGTLKRVKISVQDAVLTPVLLQEVLTALFRCTNLVQLDVIHQLPLKITDEQFTALLKACTNLERLVLNPRPAVVLSKPTLSLKALIVAAQSNPKLTHLGVFLDPDAYFDAAECARKLDLFDILGYSFETWDNLATLDLGATTSSEQESEVLVATLIKQLFIYAKVVVDDGTSVWVRETLGPLLD